MPGAAASPAALVASVAMCVSPLGNVPVRNCPDHRMSGAARPSGRKDRVPLGLDGEHQKQGNEEREDAQGFSKCDADEECGCLAGSCRGVAQCAGEEVACHVANTDSRCARADCREACADMCEFAFHDDSPYDWKLSSWLFRTLV